MTDPGKPPSMSDFDSLIEALSGKIARALEEPSAGSVTAWELKMRLHVPLSQLYLALGALQQKGRLRVAPEGLTYRILPAEPRAEAAPGAVQAAERTSVSFEPAASPRGG